MKPALSTKAALILIDVQNGFLPPSHWGTERSTPECEANITKLLTQARTHNAKTNDPSPADGNDDDGQVLICHVHHHSISPDSMLHPDKTIVVDAPSSARAWRRSCASHHVRRLVLCGLTTDHCVSTSTRMAGNLRIVDEVADTAYGDDSQTKKKATTTLTSEGDILLVGDACATYAKGGFDAERVHRVSLASLDGEFAHVAATADVIDTIFGA
ncbi:hypothetical protein PG994_004192 [Apiospora phragmitis]|uniref:Isochorismatase-like domain-containing protein n=1 Tax=Apiospora phragmitis TaxID=2905665 RepID=A0ABR1VTY1_9PEZI